MREVYYNIMKGTLYDTYSNTLDLCHVSTGIKHDNHEGEKEFL